MQEHCPFEMEHTGSERNSAPLRLRGEGLSAESQRRRDLQSVGLVVGQGLVCLAVLLTSTGVRSEQPLAWPEPSATARPWAYWDWPASAVDEANLRRELQRYSAAGMGGVHLIPIYGVKGWEEHYVEYLSPHWLQLLRTAVTEAQRRGLQVDMTTGTGWNFGGPNITPELSCLRPMTKTIDIANGESLPEPIEPSTLVALVAESASGETVDLTDQITPEGGCQWTAQGEGWKLHHVTLRSGAPVVERAAPGGEGPMLNPFYSRAAQVYLERFTDAFSRYDGPLPRAMYHDSYEYGPCAWSPDLLEEFGRRRGYRLEAFRPQLFGRSDDEVARRVRSDFRETLSDLLLDNLIRTWVHWSHRHGCQTRNQAHGSPGNLLDLYAAADIPETEMFHKDRDILISKFASSAAHVTGHPLVAAETGTWLAEHFTVTLGQLKQLVDELFLSGVNHVFYHATCYSPDEAEWPGWLFYASTQMNPRNAIWHDVSALNAYITRCQSVLQSSQSDADLLLYWPIHDLWHSQRGLVEQLTVHRRDWFHKQSIGPAASRIWQLGYDFDYVSDLQLTTAQAQQKQVSLPGGTYRAVIVPPSQLMPVRTLTQLLALAQKGATVIFVDRLPEDVPGLGTLDERRAAFRQLLSQVKLRPAEASGVSHATLGRGSVRVGPLEAAIESTGIRRESLVDQDRLAYVRRRTSEGRDYLIVNRSEQRYEGWVSLAVTAQSAALLDPLSDRVGWTPVDLTEQGRTRVFLQLEPHGSVIVRTCDEPPSQGPEWQHLQARGEPIPLQGTWHVEFLQGGPELPSAFQTDHLGSWAQQGDEAAQRFAGTAHYRLTFDAPETDGPYWLNLGAVAQSARVRLNDRELDTVIVAPFRMQIDSLQPRDNVLDVEVTSTSANRIRDLDRRDVPWKNFHDINFVNINYRRFDASKWPLHDAGLLGPVTLQAVRKVE